MLKSIKSLFFLLFLLPFSLNAQSWWEPDTVVALLSDNVEQRRIYQRDNDALLQVLLIEEKINGEWINSCKTIYTYNNFDEILTEKTLKYKDNQWEDSLQKTNKYNDKNLCIEQLIQVFDQEKKWVNAEIYLHTYDEKENCVKSLNELWWVDQWIGGMQALWSYDSNNNLKTYQLLVFSGERWINHQTTISDYDTANNLIKQKTYGSNMLTSYTSYIYDENNRLHSKIERVKKKPNKLPAILASVDDSLINSRKTIFTYNQNGNRLTETVQSWKLETWENLSEDIYTYDENNNLLSILLQSYKDGQKQNKEQWRYTYDKNNNTIYSYYENWGEDANFLNSIYYNNKKNRLSILNAVKINASYKMYSK